MLRKGQGYLKGLRTQYQFKYYLVQIKMDFMQYFENYSKPESAALNRTAFKKYRLKQLLNKNHNLM